MPEDSFTVSGKVIMGAVAGVAVYAVLGAWLTVSDPDNLALVVIHAIAVGGLAVASALLGGLLGRVNGRRPRVPFKSIVYNVSTGALTITFGRPVYQRNSIGLLIYDPSTGFSGSLAQDIGMAEASAVGEPASNVLEFTVPDPVRHQIRRALPKSHGTPIALDIPPDSIYFVGSPTSDITGYKKHNPMRVAEIDIIRSPAAAGRCSI